MSKKLSGYILYIRPMCPFCWKVLIAIKKRGLHIETRNRWIPKYGRELVKGGRKKMVPCLKHPNGNMKAMISLLF
ncbi:glutathione S-transferase N-terminal domain-containing protein [Candidatus Uabimicrobium sp. HlEnr_7]|uniref:glutathione S-transferase N-terminal domain-containing protein n=1 Tax=Candidatus Uabimicrobium helgolandensis TaxID=3095367 RepID=UPI003556C2FD